MTVNLERLFFTYILHNKNYFENVLSNFFKNPDIEFVYSIIRKYMMENLGDDVPSPRQIVEMVLLENKDNRISKEILKTLLKADLKGYDEDKFIKPKIAGWIMVNKMDSGAIDIIDVNRGLAGESDLDTILEGAAKMKAIIDKATVMDFDNDDDLGTDFDDYEEHAQDHSNTKVRTGWEALDASLGGGWDVKTLNILMAETNGGKCVTSDTYIYIRDKETKRVRKIDISKLNDMVKKEFHG